MAHRATAESFIAAINVEGVRTRMTIAHRRRLDARRGEVKITRSSTACKQTIADCALTSLNVLRRPKKSTTARNA
jgi:hypothetical protein